MKTNATISSTRAGTTTNAHIRVFLCPPGPENIGLDGVQLSTTLLASPGTQWRTGDQVIVEAIDGHGDLDQATRREVIVVNRRGGVTPGTMAVQKALIEVVMRGVIP